MVGRRMTISRETQNQLAKQDWNALEGAWLQQMESQPGDLDYFVGAARALSGTGEDKRARTLLDLLDSELKEKGLWRERLRLLQRAWALLLTADRAHREILVTLKKLYAAKPSFEGLSQSVGLQRAVEDIPKTWEKVERLEALLALDVGAIVWMDGKGAGRVCEVNLGLESFKVDFERQTGVAVGFRAAGKLLRALPPGHFLRRKLEEPEAMLALRDQDPAELLHSVLQSHERPLTAGEIKEVLFGIVADSKWTSWWGAARKHEQVLASGSGARQTYTWAETGGHATETLWQRFDKADIATKLDLWRKHAARDAASKERMAAALLVLGQQESSRRPGLAYEIWCALERAGVAPVDAPWSPEALLLGKDPRATVLGVGDRALRDRAYRLVRDKRPDWQQLFGEFLVREDDSRGLSYLVGELRAAASPELERFLDSTVAQPRKAPAAFTWLAERAAEETALLERNPLRLLQQLLAALVADELLPYRVRLRKLVESGGTLPRLLPKLAAEQAPQAYEAIQRAPGIEAFDRQPLLTALELRFPALRPQQEMPLYATAESITARHEELTLLLETEIPRNRKAIEEARAMGDLRENFEYKSARQRHEYLAARAAALDRDLRRVRPLDPAKIEPTEVRIGTRITLRADDGKERLLTILGPWESKPEHGVLSYESEVAHALLGKKSGDEVTVEGVPSVIAEIATWA
jgi:transcription elongation GreA/GreB family factor